MKTLIKFFYFYLISILLFTPALSAEKIKIGLIVPLTGEYKEIGLSILNSTRMALNSINSSRIELLPRDTKSNAKITLKISKELYKKHNVRIIIGPLFNENNIYLNQIPEVTFLSLSNKLQNVPANVISAGVNAYSQINAIKKFLVSQKLERTIFLIPNTSFKDEIENAINNTKIKLKDKYIYDTEPTLLTSQIEKITKYKIRKQNLIDEIERVENSEDVNKEKIIEKLKKKDTLGGINFDSVVIADFDQNLKSVATSLLYTDVSSQRIKYICLNQWFDKTLLKEKSLQPIYFPSINKNNYETFANDYKNKFKNETNQVSFLGYDLMGLIYYLLYKNNFEYSDQIFYENSKFKGKIGIFEINKNIITHELNFYVVQDKKFKKIF